jgi:hypothetical protein
VNQTGFLDCADRRLHGNELRFLYDGDTRRETIPYGMSGVYVLTSL